MKRVSVILLLLTVMGGCATADPDPVEDVPHGPSQRFPAQAQSWTQTPQRAVSEPNNTNFNTQP